MWGKFIENIIKYFGVILHYKIYPEYIYNVFNEAIKDNLQHVSLRLSHDSVKDDEKNPISNVEVVKIIEE